tara:strand:+ start:11930 stop:12307 length:378 start_codon:yes stop_codon:yes gene_type:complete
MAYGFSAVLPLQRDDKDGFYSLTKTLNDNIKQNVKNIMLTSPGERVMISDFGVGIRNFLFEIDSFENQNRISRRIREQFSEYLPFIEINSIEFSTNNEMIIGVRLFYSVPSINFSDLFEIIKPVL